MAKDPYRYFRIEAAELLQQLGRAALDLEKGADAGSGTDAVMRLLRLAHTLKGAARVVRVPSVADLAHALEDVLAPHREDGAVPRDKVDRILAIIDGVAAALVQLEQPATSVAAPAGASRIASAQAMAPNSYTVANAEAGAEPKLREPAVAPRLARADVAEVTAVIEGLGEIGNELEAMRRVDGELERLRTLTRQLGRQSRQNTLTPARLEAIVAELQSVTQQFERGLQQGMERARRELEVTRDAAQRLRLVPVEGMFHALERTARDAARDLDKQVHFDARGGDVRIEGTVLDAVQSAMIQLIRNAVAHSIEAPAARGTTGKPAAGSIIVEVQRRGYDAVFICRDDGAGIDSAAVRRVLAQRGQAIDSDDPDTLFRRLLAGGVSTSGSVSVVAGRGIGLNLVAETMRQLNGSVHAASEPGRGTTVSLRVPLTLAALQVLLVEAGGQVLALPLDAVQHTLRLAPSDLLRLPEGDAIVYEDEQIPLLRLSPNATAGKAATVALVRHGTGRLALAVERLAGIERVVLQPLPALAPADPTVLGIHFDLEGNPRLVLDPESFNPHAQRPAADVAAQIRPILIVDDSLTTRMLECSILESAGYTVGMAASAEEGLAMAERQSYALFLVDVEMPGMDGFTFVERTRADAVLRETPAILVSSRNGADDFARARAAGAADYIVKGEFDQARFLRRVAELVQAPAVEVQA